MSNKSLQIGTCIYCGQTRQIEVEGGTQTKELLDRQATEECDCAEAVAAHESETVKTRTEKDIEMLFKEEFPDTASLLRAAVLPIMSGEMDKITIDTGKKIKGSVVKTSKGNIKVERTETRKTTIEN